MAGRCKAAPAPCAQVPRGAQCCRATRAPMPAAAAPAVKAAAPSTPRSSHICHPPAARAAGSSRVEGGEHERPRSKERRGGVPRAGAPWLRAAAVRSEHKRAACHYSLASSSEEDEAGADPHRQLGGMASSLHRRPGPASPGQQPRSPGMARWLPCGDSSSDDDASGADHGCSAGGAMARSVTLSPCRQQRWPLMPSPACAPHSP